MRNMASCLEKKANIIVPFQPKKPKFEDEEIEKSNNSYIIMVYSGFKTSGTVPINLKLVSYMKKNDEARQFFSLNISSFIIFMNL